MNTVAPWTESSLPRRSLSRERPLGDSENPSHLIVLPLLSSQVQPAVWIKISAYSQYSIPVLKELCGVRVGGGAAEQRESTLSRITAHRLNAGNSKEDRQPDAPLLATTEPLVAFPAMFLAMLTGNLLARQTLCFGLQTCS